MSPEDVERGDVVEFKDGRFSYCVHVFNLKETQCQISVMPQAVSDAGHRFLLTNAADRETFSKTVVRITRNGVTIYERDAK